MNAIVCFTNEEKNRYNLSLSVFINNCSSSIQSNQQNIDLYLDRNFYHSLIDLFKQKANEARPNRFNCRSLPRLKGKLQTHNSQEQCQQLFSKAILEKRQPSNALPLFYCRSNNKVDSLINTPHYQCRDSEEGLLCQPYRY